MPIALVTGSARGIGRAIAINLAQHGYTVIIHYRHSQIEAEQVLHDIQTKSPDSSSIAADLTSDKAVTQLFQYITQRYGQLHVLVNTVGDLGRYVQLAETTVTDFQEVFANNVLTTVGCITAALPLLQQTAANTDQPMRIINFACAGADHSASHTYTVPYYIAKQGIITLTQSWAKALAPSGITVNAIAPGIVENSQVTVSHLPMQRPAQFSDITAAVEFLVSPSANYISGSTITVSGAWQP